MNDWIARLFESQDMLKMGHCQRFEDANLGMGWLYYGLVRLIRPKNVVVIGSYRGFTPLIFGKALLDNVEGGTVSFVDPSFVDVFWKNANAVQDHFHHFGVTNIEHHLMTTQQFVESDSYRALEEVGIIFIDGYHSEEQARFDYEAFAHLVSPDGVVLLHDSVRVDEAVIYGPEKVYQRRVKYFVDDLKKDSRLQVFDLPWANGLTFVRRS